MTTLTLKSLSSAPSSPPASREWIRVQLDTGGIAAGACEVLDELRRLGIERHSAIPVTQVGSIGLAFADPVVDLRVNGMPRTLYGRCTPKLAGRIMAEHVSDHRLIDDHVIASRSRGLEIEEPVTHILVRDTGADAGNKTEFFQFSLIEELRRRGADPRIQVVRAMDLGLYDEGMAVQLLPSNVTYANVLAPDVARIVGESVLKGKVVDDLLWKENDRQVRVVLRNCGEVDPDDIGDYVLHGNGYRAFAKVIDCMTPAQVIEEMKLSGLRGRGGAGFPTWLKWQITGNQKSDERFVICNGDEGDPGAFMDRSVLESDPHSVLEGMLIAAYAMGSTRGYFYIRAEYPKAVERIERAITQARDAGLLGRNILGSSFSFEMKVRLGAGAFVCGEETALIASIEGRRGSPSPRPPYPSVRGLWGKPTAINNVETLASVPAILLHGGSWYSRWGTDTSKGTKVFAVTGKVKNAQLVEVPMGTSLRQIVYSICGGVLDDKEIKAVQTGGPSGGVIPDKLLDTPVSYETLQQLGSIMGSGGMLVMDKTDSMVDVAKFYLRFCVDESCGKCAPCRIGGYQMLQILDRISRGRGSPADIPTLRRICSAMQKASLCGLGQTAPNPVLSTLRYFEDEYTSFIEGGPSYARKMARQSTSSEPARESTPVTVAP